MATSQVETADSATIRTTVRLPTELHEQAVFWAGRKEPSFNDYVITSVTNQIARDSGAEIDTDSVLAARMAQLTDAMLSMQSQLDVITENLSGALGMIITLARGDHNVLADDDGELAVSGD